jgi:hypothetical protein
MNASPTEVVVASGVYDQANGETFPIAAPDQDFTLLGPGDGSAIIRGDSQTSILIDLNGNSTGAIYTVDGLRLEEGVRVIYLDDGSQFNITNNEFVGGLYGVHTHTHEDGLGILIENNTFSGQSGAAAQLEAHSAVSVSFVVRGNSISGSGWRGLDVEFSVSDSSSSVGGSVLIEGNTITGASDEAIAIDLTMSDEDTMVMDVDVTVRGNTVTDAGWDGLQIDFSIDSSEENHATLDILIEDNTISGSEDDNVWMTYYAESTANTVDLSLTCLNNSLTAAGDDALDMSFSISDESTSMTADVAITGNTMTDCADSGLEMGVDMDTSSNAVMHIDVLASNNEITGNGDGVCLNGVDAAYTSGQAMDFNLRLLENTITGNSVHGVILSLTSSTSSSSSSSFSNSFAITVNNNTIVGNSVETRGTTTSTSTTTHYEFELSDATDALLSSVDATGNFWGTQDAAAIAERVYDGVDEAGLPLVDHSAPRPSTLSFDVDVFDEGGVLVFGIFAADDGSRFVPYAGETDLLVTVDGTQVTDLMGNGTTVVYGLLPDGLSGIVDFCVTNPGGQSGCAQYNFDPGPNSAPVAVYDSASTPNGTAVTIDLVANDTDVDDNLDPASVSIVQAPGQGTVVNNGDGTVTYTPNSGGDTSDTFNYTVSDTGGLTSNIATVQVSTTGGNNNIPTAVYDSTTTGAGQSVSIDLLANDWDVDGDDLVPGTVVIESAPHAGTVTVTNGVATYTPLPMAAGRTDTFNYSVEDSRGGRSNIATVEVYVEPNVGLFR